MKNTIINKNKDIQMLVAFQTLLGDMGFTLSGNGTYYKDYRLHNGSNVRLIPHFNTDPSTSKVHQLSAISINNSKIVLIKENGNTELGEFPKECMEDVTKMIVMMAPQSRMILKETYVITEHCNMCSNKISSFFKKDGEAYCINCV